MMANNITIGGVTIFTGGSGGACWDWRPGEVVPELMSRRPPLGNGAIRKDLGTPAGTHELEIVWRGTDYGAITTTAQGHVGRTGDLVLPGKGTVARCTIMGMKWGREWLSDGGNWMRVCTYRVEQDP